MIEGPLLLGYWGGGTGHQVPPLPALREGNHVPNGGGSGQNGNKSVQT